MPTITTKDGTEIFYKDWGSGQPIVFGHGWAPPADDWDAQMLFFSRRGYRVLALDRRGHSRSSQVGEGHDMDHDTSDVAALTAHLDRRAVQNVGRGVQSADTDKPFFANRPNPTRAAPTEVSFGPFCLLPTQFLLLEGDKPVPLGSRALEILMVLLERPGELVSKQELMARVWPNTFVEPANLTVHISALRRALRDGQDGNRFIINIPGRGYSFVASVASVAPVEADGDENRAGLRGQPSALFAAG